MKLLGLVALSAVAFLPIQPDFGVGPTGELAASNQSRSLRGPCGDLKCSDKRCAGTYASCGTSQSCEIGKCIAKNQSLTGPCGERSCRGKPCQGDWNTCGTRDSCEVGRGGCVAKTQSCCCGGVEPSPSVGPTGAHVPLAAANQSRSFPGPCGERDCRERDRCKGDWNFCGTERSCRAGRGGCVSKSQSCCCGGIQPAAQGSGENSNSVHSGARCKFCEGE
jgi:hypothetical protein